jgi:hypothetical protein
MTGPILLFSAVNRRRRWRVIAGRLQFIAGSLAALPLLALFSLPQGKL